ncbi:MAG: hypothetical protein GX348_05070 [Veillonellaceae bacterium]|jgi:hypothetical protein|nr:hypothetical protein [Veillonellaceae bacterium]
MLELCLGVMATASCIINYQDLGNRNIDADGNKISSGNRSCDFLNSLVLKLGNATCIKIAGLMWLIAYGYHYIIAILFPMSVMLNMLNIMVAVLISLRFCRLMYRLTSSQEGAPLFHSDLLTTTACIWEIILAGVVLVHLFLYY